MNEHAFHESTLLNLMARIQADLFDPGPLFERPSPNKGLGTFNRAEHVLGDEQPAGYTFAPEIGVRGKLLVKDVAIEGTYEADCTFTSSVDWRVNPPKTFCAEAWMKKDIDWHLVPEVVGSSVWRLCYDLEQRWRDCVKMVEQSNSDPFKVLEYAASYWIQQSRWLIEKHLFAHRQNITIWPRDQWKAWPHNRETAQRQYREESLKAG